MVKKTSLRKKVAVAGAGIYGVTVALRLSKNLYDVTLFDPLGVLNAASSINQYRIHSGYHYPRSEETIAEILEARDEFMTEYSPAIMRTIDNYYAIPYEGSKTLPDHYEAVMAEHGLKLKACTPSWMNFDFISRCYEVNESVYDPNALRRLLVDRLKSSGIRIVRSVFPHDRRDEYDFFVSATYGLGPSKGMFGKAKIQVAEKILIQLPDELRGKSLVVVDGPFTAFDPYGDTKYSLFGSAKYTNHWESCDTNSDIPEHFRLQLNQADFEPSKISNFESMKLDGALAVPLVSQAKYIGSKYTIRVVENDPLTDRRTLYIREDGEGNIHIFSGKVVCAVKAARLVCEKLAKYE